jgi:MerR family copper efflux transcriptional regulator
MLIGELAKKTNLTIHAVRYYEKLGLFKTQTRRSNNYKEYPEEAVDILIFITRAKNLGFSIQECKEVIDLYKKKSHPKEVIMKRVSDKLLNVKSKLANLNKIKSALEKILEEAKQKNDKGIVYDFKHLVEEIQKIKIEIIDE